MRANSQVYHPDIFICDVLDNITYYICNLLYIRNSKIFRREKFSSLRSVARSYGQVHP